MREPERGCMRSGAAVAALRAALTPVFVCRRGATCGASSVWSVRVSGLHSGRCAATLDGWLHKWRRGVAVDSMCTQHAAKHL